MLLISLFIICGMRYQVGGDWNVYLNAYNLIKSGGFDYPHEPLFRYLVKASTNFEYGYLILNLVSSFLFLGFIVVALYKSRLKYELTNFLFFSFPIGIIFMNLGFVRQAIACSICLLSYVYFVRKKYALTILFLIIAQGFHISAFLFVFYLLFIYWSNLSNQKLQIYIVVACSLLGCLSLILLFTIRKDYIGGYKSDGLLPRIIYVILLSSILISLKNLSNFKRIFKIIAALIIVTLSGFAICKYLLITTVLDRALYYLILPICLEIIRELTQQSKSTKLKVNAFHYLYSFIFLIGWFAFSPNSIHWRNYKFWTF